MLYATHFNMQLKGTVVFAMKSIRIKMAVETFPKLTWTFQLRASQGHDQPSLPGIEMTWLRVCLHHLTGELDEGNEPLFFL